MDHKQVVFGRWSVVLSVSGWVLPLTLVTVAKMTALPDEPLSMSMKSLVGLLFLVLVLASIALGAVARDTTCGKIALGLSIPSLLIVCGAGIWSSSNPAYNPDRQTVAYMEALRDQNWRKLWDLTEFSPIELRVWRSPEIYDRDMRRNLESPGVAEGFHYFTEMRDLSAGKPLIHGDRAEVPTCASIYAKGHDLHLHGWAHLRRRGDTWRVVICEHDWDDPMVGILGIYGIPYNPTTK